MLALSLQSPRGRFQYFTAAVASYYCYEVSSYVILGYFRFGCTVIIFIGFALGYFSFFHNEDLT